MEPAAPPVAPTSDVLPALAGSLNDVLMSVTLLPQPNGHHVLCAGGSITFPLCQCRLSFLRTETSYVHLGPDKAVVRSVKFQPIIDHLLAVVKQRTPDPNQRVAVNYRGLVIQVTSARRGVTPFPVLPPADGWLGLILLPSVYVGGEITLNAKSADARTFSFARDNEDGLFYVVISTLDFAISPVAFGHRCMLVYEFRGPTPSPVPVPLPIRDASAPKQVVVAVPKMSSEGYPIFSISITPKEFATLRYLFAQRMLAETAISHVRYQSRLLLETFGYEGSAKKRRPKKKYSKFGAAILLYTLPLCVARFAKEDDGTEVFLPPANERTNGEGAMMSALYNMAITTNNWPKACETVKNKAGFVGTPVRILPFWEHTMIYVQPEGQQQFKPLMQFSWTLPSVPKDET